MGRVPLNVSDHRRISTAIGYLMPALHRPNLRVESGVNVIRIAFSGTRAIGVRRSRRRQCPTHSCRPCGRVFGRGGDTAHSPEFRCWSSGTTCRARSFRRSRSTGRRTELRRPPGSAAAVPFFQAPHDSIADSGAGGQPSTSLRSKSVRTPHLSQTWFPVRLAWTTASEWS